MELAGISGVSVVLVVSSSFKSTSATMTELEHAGCIIFADYLTAIEELYGLSDCYIFTVDNPHGAIDVPLSILEAMSCDLPIITTRFGGIPDYFSSNNLLRYIEDPDQLCQELIAIKESSSLQGNRARVLEHDWDSVVSRLELLYTELEYE